MALDGPPIVANGVAPNATAEHEAAGGDFDAAMAAAMADDTDEGLNVETETADDVNAPVAKPAAGKTADEAEKEGAEEVEAKAEEPAAKPKDEKPKPEDDDGIKLRSGFRALARDRQKIREREAAATVKEQAAAQYAQKAQAFDQVIARLKAGDATLLQEVGGDELINKFLDGVIASEKTPAEREVAKMRAELDRRDAEAKTREQQQVVETWKASVRSAVTAQADTFDLVNSLGHHDAVIATIEAYYAQYSTKDANGNVIVPAILDVATAAQAVEDTLAKGLAKSKKFGARVPVNNAPPAKGTTAPSSRKAGSVTLSSVHSSELPSGDGDDLPLDDPNERFRRVMAGIG